jgi:hypothetical protein
MSGRLKMLSTGAFCIEYPNGVYIRWTPGNDENAKKPKDWVKSDLPNQTQVPANSVQSLIRSRAQFSSEARLKDKKVEIPGQLDDGGSIVIGYVKGSPPETLSDVEKQEAIKTLETWKRSYLQSGYT